MPSALLTTYWQRVQAQAAQYRPRVQRALLRAIATMRDEFTDADMQRLLAEGSLNLAVLDMFSAASIQSNFAQVDVAIQSTVASTMRAMRAFIPGDPGTAVGVFNVLSPDVVIAIQTLDSRVMQPFEDAIVETVRAEVQRSFAQQLGYRTAARNLRDVLGLPPNLADAVANFRGLLETGDLEALSRALRDKRFDPTLARLLGADGKGLSPKQIDAMTSAYARRAVAFNADTIARTATLDSVKLGQHLTWEQAVDDGTVDGDRLQKTWVGNDDGKEREEHIAMNGETVPYDEPYSNGQMVPGDTEYNCRCISHYSLAPRTGSARLRVPS